MTKAELTEKIIDRLDDPYTMSREDYQYCLPINIYEAEDLLDQFRDDERKEDLDQDERLPQEVTPALLMEAYNCFLRYQKHELRIDRIAEYLTEHECVSDYDYLKDNYLSDPLVVLPTDFLIEDEFPFPMVDDMYPHPMFLIELGQRSPSLNLDDNYCWYDREKFQMFSSNTPFADGIIDAYELAKHIMSDNDSLKFFLAEVSDDDIKKIFGCTIDELRTELNMKGE